MAASAGNAVGTIAGFKKSAEGKRMQKLAQSKIDSFEWQELSNPYKNLQVSTAGADLRREEAARNTATSVDAIRSGGTRSIAANLGKVQAQNNLTNADIAANLDEQQKSIDMMAAQDEAAIRGMNEVRQANELAGYGQMMNVGMGMKYQGLGDVQATGQAQSQHNLEIMEMVKGFAGSDRRLKENIKKIGESEKGLNIYSFEYKDKDKFGKGVYQGVMSDEVPSEFVTKSEDGFDMVDYSGLDVEFKKIG